MTLQTSAHGRLGKTPRQIQTQTGTTMATASVAVTVPLSRGDDTETLWFDVVAFGRVAEQLLRHQQGDMVNVFGAVQINRWQTDSGETRQNWQIVAEAILSARTTRPGKRKASQPTKQPAPEFDDALNF